MNKVISIYPNNDPDYLKKCEEYISLAKQYSFQEIFTSIHLPEIDLDKQIEFLYQISILSKKYNMELIADIGGKSIKEIISNDYFLNKLKDTNLDYLRLDYGYDHDDISYLSKVLNNKGFVINASIYNKEDSIKEVEFIRSLYKEVKACHNFYPREESGIDKEFALSQKEIFNELSVPIYYCVPSQINPRGPIFKGLPTIESHRYKPIDLIMLELINDYRADGIMLSDNFYRKEDFAIIDSICNKKEINITAVIVNDEYSDIVYQTHEFRYDSNSNYLRSKSSRTMAEKGKEIEPYNCTIRSVGSITIDNKNYQRYSGELQIVLNDNKADPRVNVVGYLQDVELEKLNYYRYGYKYIFTK